MPIIKGKHAIVEAMTAGISIQKIMLSQHISQSQDLTQILNFARKHQIPVETLPKKELSRRSKDETHQSILAMIEDVKLKPLSHLIDKENPIVLAVDHIEDPYNFGAMMRSAKAFGVTSILFPKDRNTALNAGVIKASSGAAYHLDLYQVTNLATACEQLQKNGFWVYASAMSEGQSVTTAKINTPIVLVMGNEHKGVSKRMMQVADETLHIPMIGGFESLNVSVATGILLYEISQRIGS